jgi:hypothetical protein
MMQERNYRIGHFFLGVVVLTWGANFGIVKSAYDTIKSLAEFSSSWVSTTPLKTERNSFSP